MTTNAAIIDIPMIYQIRGKRLENMTRAELIETVKDFGRLVNMNYENQRFIEELRRLSPNGRAA